MHLMKNEQYLKKGIKDHNLIGLTILVPAFLGGWAIGKKRWLGMVFRELTNIGMVAMVAHFKKQIINAFIKLF